MSGCNLHNIPEYFWINYFYGTRGQVSLIDGVIFNYAASFVFPPDTPWSKVDWPAVGRHYESTAQDVDIGLVAFMFSCYDISSGCDNQS